MDEEKIKLNLDYSNNEKEDKLKTISWTHKWSIVVIAMAALLMIGAVGYAAFNLAQQIQ